MALELHKEDCKDAPRNNDHVAGAKSSMDGVPAERKWLKKKYGNYEKLKQALVKEGGKYYDLVTIRTKKGKELVVYFDISGFFNREE